MAHTLKFAVPCRTGNSLQVIDIMTLKADFLVDSSIRSGKLKNLKNRLFASGRGPPLLRAMQHPYNPTRLEGIVSQTRQRRVCAHVALVAHLV
jgi:hypothetical protein